jgi:SAM-dependent methyltransferase
MNKRGVRLTPLEFHDLVNRTFHRFESRYYDRVHDNMWRDLPLQFERLSRDALHRGRQLPRRVRALDVGCGTGLGSELLLRTELGRRVDRLDLLDTSPEMLERCAKRAAGWRVEHRLVEGTLSRLQGQQYGLVLVCSVLHHIPDIAGFLAELGRVVVPDGLFLHVQDPNGDYLQDPELRRRINRLAARRDGRFPWWRTGLRMAGALWRRFDSRRTYLGETNAALLDLGVIRTRMTAAELWSVTDPHVDGLPYSLGAGLSVSKMQSWLETFDLLSAPSYAFFGCTCSQLPPSFQGEELELVRQEARNGKLIAGAWQRRP